MDGARVRGFDDKGGLDLQVILYWCERAKAVVRQYNNTIFACVRLAYEPDSSTLPLAVDKPVILQIIYFQLRFFCCDALYHNCAPIQCTWWACNYIFLRPLYAPVLFDVWTHPTFSNIFHTSLHDYSINNEGEKEFSTVECRSREREEYDFGVYVEISMFWEATYAHRVP